MDNNNQPIETKNYRKAKMSEKKKKGMLIAASAAALCLCAVAFWFWHPHVYSVKEIIKAPTCIEAGEGIGKCFCGKKEMRTLETVGHTEVIDKGFEATKTESGLTDGKHCSVCGEVFEEQMSIYPLGSSGLAYKATSVADCEITGIGDCKDDKIVIPRYIDGYAVTAISDYAFRWCSNITSITIPVSVTSIGTDAFASCGSLTSITIPDGVRFIKNFAFSNCTSLESIIIPDSVIGIGNSAFAHCGSLRSITIPDNVTDIGKYAFWACTILKSVTIPNSVTSIDENAFMDCVSLATITYTGTVAEWKNLKKSSHWDSNTPYYTVYCTDGTVTKEGNVAYN